MLVVGLMSGTSVDGIDAALVRIGGRPPEIRIRLIDWAIRRFSDQLRRRILRASTRSVSAREICDLHFELGERYALSVKALCRRARVPLSKVSLIGSHGQTICHRGLKGTLQIGEPSVIAERTGITTIADFRPRDIAAGGHGAPLAPYFHALYFRDPKRNIAVHNLGGISNLTFIPKGGRPTDVIGFDTGPANMVIDGLLQRLKVGKVSYDHGGRLAAQGLVSLELLHRLMDHPFILKSPPKTSGREEFGERFVEEIVQFGRRRRLRPHDLIATATAFTALSVAENYRRFVFPKGMPDEIVFGGGGTRNRTLMAMIGHELAGIRLSTFDDHGLPADAAEAVCFATLAYLTWLGIPANLPSVTGARQPAILGKIILGKRAALGPS